MSLKQILSTTFVLASSLLARADSHGSRDSSSSDSGSGSGGYGSSSGGYGSSGSYGSGSSGSYGSGSGSGSGSYYNQGSQSSSSSMGSGGGGGGGGKGLQGGSYTTGWNQNTQMVETISVTETSMMTMTVTESVCSTNAVATWAPSMGGGPPSMSGSGGSWGSSGSSGSVSVQVVTVSDMSGSLTYSPNMVVAEVGSIVEFHFYPKNHTVTQSSFAAPCVPIGVSTPNITTPGIKSGFVPVAANATDFMAGIRSSFSIMINDTKPIWLYCGQVGHCQKGMSMVINQNMTDTVKTLANYQAAAAMLPVANGTATSPPPGVSPPAGVAPPSGQSTSTSTFTAPAFPPPSTDTPPAVTEQPATTTPATVATATSAASVGTFTGGAATLPVKKMSTAAGVLAMAVAALL